MPIGFAESKRLQAHRLSMTGAPHPLVKYRLHRALFGVFDFSSCPGVVDFEDWGKQNIESSSTASQGNPHGRAGGVVQLVWSQEKA